MTRNDFIHRIMAGLWIAPESEARDFERAMRGAEAFADQIEGIAPFDAEAVELEAQIVELRLAFEGLNNKLNVLDARTRPPGHRG